VWIITLQKYKKNAELESFFGKKFWKYEKLYYLCTRLEEIWRGSSAG
jgi:hypothetical protein